MKFSNNAMSAILLCSYIGINSDDVLKPLTLKEWNELLDRVVRYGQQPAIVMEQGQNFLKETGCSEEYIERIKRLMDRGGTVAFKLDDMDGKGINVVTMFDSDYPVLIKRRLKRKMPPVLFYSGDIGLAKKIGIGVAGSRNADEVGIQFTQKLVEKAAAERLIVYSGGAKGVDAAAERTAVELGSAAVSFVADSMISKISQKETLDSIISQKRLLLSDVRPDVGFSAARAMNRNKYIYASSYGTFIVSSDYNKGGTWAGATEAMKNEWTKVFVWKGGQYEGNGKLLEKGAIPYELSNASILELLTKKEEKFQQMDLFSLAREMPECSAEESSQAAPEIGEEESGRTEQENSQIVLESRTDEETDLYHVIAPYVLKHIGEGMTKEEAAEAFHVAKQQMYIWLKQLCEDSCLKCVKGRYIRR